MILPEEVFYSSGARKEIHEKLLHFVRGLVPPFGEIPKKLQTRVAPKISKQPLGVEPPSDIITELAEKEIDSWQKAEPIKTWYPGISVTDWLMLNWLKSLSKSKKGERGVALIDLIQQRDLYKRVCTIPRDKTNILIEKLDDLWWPEKITLCENIQKIVYETIKEREPDLL